MIVDKIENLKLYIPYNQKLTAVCDFLEKTDVSTLADGDKIQLGDGVHVMVKAFTPKAPADARWEIHKKYIDIQYIIEGDEAMGWLPLEEVEGTDYNAEKDISHPNALPDAQPGVVALVCGSFAYLEPRDAHRPGAKLESATAKKLIFKVPV